MISHSVKELLIQAKQKLNIFDSAEASASAEFLMADLLKCSRTELHLRLENTLCTDLVREYEGMIERRRRHEPVAYILGKAHFWNEELEINRHCLIPRSETELIVEKFIEKLASRRMETFNALDLCSGSGALGIALLREFPQLKMSFIDISPEALKVVALNVQKYELERRAELIENNLFETLQGKVWDIIVSNPPYLSHSDWETGQAEIRQEPQIAFVAGFDGLDFYRKILSEAPRHLSEGGLIFLELGAGQSDEVGRLAKQAGLKEIEIFKDFQDIERVLVARV